MPLPLRHPLPVHHLADSAEAARLAVARYGARRAQRHTVGPVLELAPYHPVLGGHTIDPATLTGTPGGLAKRALAAGHTTRAAVLLDLRRPDEPLRLRLGVVLRDDRHMLLAWHRGGGMCGCGLKHAGSSLAFFAGWLDGQLVNLTTAREVLA